ITLATTTLPVLPADRGISTQSGAISVTLAADRSSYAPGASATLTVTTTDAQRAGVRADLLLGLVGAIAAPRHDLGQTFGGAAPPPIATARLPGAPPAAVPAPVAAPLPPVASVPAPLPGPLVYWNP